MQDNKIFQVLKIEQLDLENFKLTIESDGQTFEQMTNSQTLIKLEMLKPRNLTPDEFQTLCDETNFGVAYQKSLNYISYRKRSKGELKEYLCKKHNFSFDVCRQVIDKLETQGYANDQQFARAYIADALITTNKGPGKLFTELTSKYGCDELMVQANIDELFDIDKQEEMLDKSIQKMLRKKYLSPSHARAKMKEKLFANGFSRERIVCSMQRIVDEDILRDDNKVTSFLEKAWEQAMKKEMHSYELKQFLLNKLVQKKISFDEAAEFVESFLLTKEK